MRPVFIHVRHGTQATVVAALVTKGGLCRHILHGIMNNTGGTLMSGIVRFNGGTFVEDTIGVAGNIVTSGVLSYTTAYSGHRVTVQTGVDVLIPDGTSLYFAMDVTAGAFGTTYQSLILWFDDSHPANVPEEDPLGPLTGVRGRRRSSILEAARGRPLARESFLDDRKKPAH